MCQHSLCLQDLSDEQASAKQPGEDSKKEGKQQTAGQRIKKLLEQVGPSLQNGMIHLALPA